MSTNIDPKSQSQVDNLLRTAIALRVQSDQDFFSSVTRDRHDSAHALFQYPAMMIPNVQRRLMQIVTSVQPGIRSMLDPFVGAGTTFAAAMHCGLDCYGQDINPLAVLLTRVKTGPFYIDGIKERLAVVIDRARTDESDVVEADFPKIHKWFQPRAIAELSRLRRSIRAEEFLWARRFMWIALAEVVRLTSNDRTTTYKLHARPAEEIANRNISPIAFFRSVTDQNISDLSRFASDLEVRGLTESGRYIGKVSITLSDTSKTLVAPNMGPSNGYDLLVTSPPYGDNTSTIAYGQHSYLPLQWIDLCDIDADADDSFLQSSYEIDRRSLGGSKSRLLGELVDDLSKQSGSLSATLSTLMGQPRDRLSRVASFYRDFAASLERVVDAMAVDAYLIWTIGNRRVGGIEIPNDQITTELLANLRVSLVTQLDRNIYQKRMPHRNSIAQMMSREKIMIYRKVGAMENLENRSER